MTSISITCDWLGKTQRVAVWQDNKLRDLYFNNSAKPDLTGAIVGGKITRIMAGQKTAFLDCGLEEQVRVTNFGQGRTGDYLALKITKVPREGKAWTGALHNKDVSNSKIGILEKPLLPWQRAVEYLKGTKIKSIQFAECEDYKACQYWIEENRPELLTALQPVSREPVHPDLDDIIDQLMQPHVELAGGGNIVIQETEALVAIDVNNAENRNSLAVNLEAAKEIACQIRWRNLSGIIIVDALKMSQRTDKAKVLNAITKAVAVDPVSVSVFGLTKLGLIEMTRKHDGFSLSEIMFGLSNGEYSGPDYVE